MQTFKPNAVELPPLQAAAASLKEANRCLAEAKKSSEAAKATIENWLKSARGLNVSTLAIGEVVNVDGVVMLRIGSMNKFDEKGFASVHAELYVQFKRNMLVKRFDPLV